MGTFGFSIIASKGFFESDYYAYNEYARLYRSKFNDTTFDRGVEVKSKYQYLVFDKEPAYKPEQQLSGYLAVTSEDFYRRSGRDMPAEKTSIRAKIYFTCTVKKRGPGFR
jgi:hypothetical protein